MLINSRYSFGGDEHLFVECSEEMSLDAFFKSLSLTNAIRTQGISGITEICPANASFQIKFNPDQIAPDDLLREIRAIEEQAENAKPTIKTRIMEVPVYYQDPWTHETLMRFRERHQAPNLSDLEYAAEVNGLASVEELIAAHSGAPWFVTMVGFVAGLPFMYQMVERQRQLQVPKYLRPRTDTPRLTVGAAGCFTCIYSVRGAGGYQMFGVTPMPIYDSSQTLSYLRDFMVLFRPGDIVKFRPIGRSEYDTIVEDVNSGRYSPIVREIEFDLTQFKADLRSYNTKIEDQLYGY